MLFLVSRRTWNIFAFDFGCFLFFFLSTWPQTSSIMMKSELCGFPIAIRVTLRKPQTFGFICFSSWWLCYWNSVTRPFRLSSSYCAGMYLTSWFEEKICSNSFAGLFSIPEQINFGTPFITSHFHGLPLLCLSFTYPVCLYVPSLNSSRTSGYSSLARNFSLRESLFVKSY